VDISPMNPIIPQDIQKLVNDKRDEIIKGTAHPFAGPIKDQKGVERVPKGKILDDKSQLSMNWYVEGIEGAIPKQ
jgi:basic membrane protein A and related proteins